MAKFSLAGEAVSSCQGLGGELEAKETVFQWTDAWGWLQSQQLSGDGRFVITFAS